MLLNIPIQPKLFYTDPTKAFYYLILEPGEPAMEFSRKLKDEAKALYGKHFSICHRPHITILGYLMSKQNEGELVSVLNRIVVNIWAPKLNTSSIAEFPSSKTVFVSLTDQEEANDIRKQIHEELLSTFLIKKRLRDGNLHITIATGMDIKKMNFLFDHLQQFDRDPIEFTCSKLVLMKQDLVDGSKQDIATFELQTPVVLQSGK